MTTSPSAAARWAKRAGHELVGLNEEDGALVFYVKKG